MKKTLLLAGFAGMIAANAEAVDVTPYVGLDANYAIADRDSVLDNVLSTKDLSLSAVLGARTDRFGLEAFYNAGNKENKGDFKSRISGYGVDALVFQQLGCSGRWELVGSAGVASYNVKINKGIGNDRGHAERLGAGFQYAVNEDLSVRAMYHHAWVHDSKLNDLDEFTVGLRYAF